MMTTLIGLNIKALFSRMFTKYRGNKRRNPIVGILIGLLTLYVIGSLLSLFTVTFFSINKPLFSAGLGWLYFAIMGIAIFCFCFIGTVFTAQAQLFTAKDNELLLSLPIKPAAILTGRLASLLVLEYVFEAFIALPALVIWVMFQPVTAVSLIFFILAVLVLPLLALTFASLIAWLVALITSRMRNKNVVTLILSLGFLFLYFKLFNNLTSHMNQLIVDNGGRIADAVQASIFPAYHLGLAIAQGNVLSLLLYLLCVLVPFGLMVLLMSVNFIRLTTANRGAARIKYREKTLKVSGVRLALLKKELLHFWANPMYIINAGLGGVFMLVGAVLLIINKARVFATLAQLSGANITIAPGTLVIVALCVLAAMNFVSAPSVSLEGKNLWIAKSLPARAIDILMAKVHLHVLVTGIPAVFAGLMAGVTLGVGPLELLLLILLPLLVVVTVGLFGVTMNLQFPRFDWINEIQPIKQSISVMLSMFGAWALLAAFILVYALFLAPVLSVTLYLIVFAAVLVLLSGILYGYLKAGGTRRFEAL